MNCPKCNYTLSYGEVICPKCGFNTKPNEVPKAVASDNDESNESIISTLPVTPIKTVMENVDKKQNEKGNRLVFILLIAVVAITAISLVWYFSNNNSNKCTNTVEINKMSISGMLGIIPEGWSYLADNNGNDAIFIDEELKSYALMSFYRGITMNAITSEKENIIDQIKMQGFDEVTALDSVYNEKKYMLFTCVGENGPAHVIIIDAGDNAITVADLKFTDEGDKNAILTFLTTLTDVNSEDNTFKVENGISKNLLK